MKKTWDPPEPHLSPGAVLHGFRVEHVRQVGEIRGVAYCLRHEKSGARVIHLHTRDSENLMAIAFRTPPQDDTGLPHILEHTVLCGSSKYPVKDPFVELLRTSLATFLNAITYPDKTVYPCASMNEKDFFNLAGVYCDAVFHPLLLPGHFKQEGHHFDFRQRQDPHSPLIIKGIVYNEMKGAFSNLDGTIEYHGRKLFPDNAYGRVSGGDPEAIPSLTYEQFVAFHRRFYHPSNAYIFLYGDIETEKHLAFLDGQFLCSYERLDIDTSIAPQPRWSEPRREVCSYPAESEDKPENRSAAVVTFFTNEITDVYSTLSMQIIEQYLLGNDASPLRKALIDSKLGEDLTHSGYGDYQRDTLFSVGLKGTSPDRTDAIVNLVLDTCRTVAVEGLDKRKVEAAFHQLGLGAREVTAMYPLHVMGLIYDSWIYDADPLFLLEYGKHLDGLGRKLASEDRYLEKQLERLIVNNPHYLVLTLVPDAGMTAQREKEAETNLARAKSRLSEGELATIAAEAGALEELQNTPNSPEALATLPTLRLSDVSPYPIPLDTDRDLVSARPLLNTHVFANGLSYLKLALDLSGLDDGLVEFLPLYSEAIRKMGAGDDDYLTMAERESLFTGGVSATVSATGRYEDPLHVQPFLFVESHALDGKIDGMLSVLADRVLTPDFSDLDRLKTIILQSRVRKQSGLVPAGNRYAVLYAQRNISRNTALAERLAGITQLRFLDSLARDVDRQLETVADRLVGIRDAMLEKGRVHASFLGSETTFGRTRAWYEQFSDRMADGIPPTESGAFESVTGARDGIALAADVAFVAQVFPMVAPSHPLAPALIVLDQMLSFGYLWNEVRAKRGAYGCRAAYNQAMGVFSLASYRDPYIHETLATYADILRHIRQDLDLSAESVEQAIIGSVKTLDQPTRPGTAVSRALAFHLGGITDDIRQQFRDRLLSVGPATIRQAAEELLAPAFREASVCVISSRNKLESANVGREETALDIHDLQLGRPDTL